MTKKNPRGGWTIVASYSDQGAAYIAKGMLESNGILVEILNATISTVYPMTDTWAPVELAVPSSMADLAHKLLSLEGEK